MDNNLVETLKRRATLKKHFLDPANNYILNKYNASDMNENIAKDYIAKIFELVVKYVKYDHESVEKVKKITNLEERIKEYNKYFNLDRCLFEGRGCCKHFACLLAAIVTDEDSLISKMKANKSNTQPLNFETSLVNCKYYMPDGSYDGHTISCFTIGGKRYYCDPSTATHMLDDGHPFMNVCLKTANELNAAIDQYKKGEFISADNIGNYIIYENSNLSAFDQIESYCNDTGKVPLSRFKFTPLR